MKYLLIILVIIGFTACSQPSQEIILLKFNKDLIPEGIAIDPETNTIFINSLKNNKIVSCNIDGTKPTDFIQENQYNYVSGFGMTVKGNILFALGNSLPKTNNRSILLLLNAKTGDSINAYTLNDSTTIYLNDLAISEQNDIYITDSESNRIYTIQDSEQQLDVYLENDEIARSNGIAISNDNKYLYLATYRNGIRVIDIKTKAIINKPNKDYIGIDGLKFYNNSLIGIVNAYRDESKNGLFRYYLNKESTKILKKEKLLPQGEHFKLPTTFVIHDDYIYFVIDSQLDNLNQENNKIIDTSKLETYSLLKKKIE